jgi:hypothetical protein
MPGAPWVGGFDPPPTTEAVADWPSAIAQVVAWLGYSAQREREITDQLLSELRSKIAQLEARP